MSGVCMSIQESTVRRQPLSLSCRITVRQQVSYRTCPTTRQDASVVYSVVATVVDVIRQGVAVAEYYVPMHSKILHNAR